jgi:hypothetical protein
MAGSRISSTSGRPLQMLVICSDANRRELIESQCLSAAPQWKVESLQDVSSAMFKLAANDIGLVILDEVSLGPSPAALEGMMKSLNGKVAILTVVDASRSESRNLVEVVKVATWVSAHCSRSQPGSRR